MRREWGVASLVFAAMAALFTAAGFLPDRVMLPLDLPRDSGAWKSDPAERVVVSNKELSDAVLEFHAWDVEARREIAAGRFPWRNRFAGEGAPLFANPESGLAFPLTWIRIALGDRGWALACFLKLFLGALGMWWLARVMTGCSPRAALASGFVYATCGYFTVWLLSPHTNVYAVLPWLAASLLRFLRAPSRGAVAAVIATAALATAGGHPETLFYGVTAIAVFIAWQGRSERWRAVPFAVVCALIGFLLLSVQVIPFVTAASRSALLASRAAHAPRFVRLFAVPATLVPGFLGSPLAGEIDLSGIAQPSAESFNERSGGYAGLVALILIAIAWRRLPAAARRGVIIGVVALVLSWRVVPLFAIGASHRLGLVFAFFVSAAVGAALDDLGSRTRGLAASGEGAPRDLMPGSLRALFVVGALVLALALFLATPFAQPLLMRFARSGIAALQHRGYLHQTAAVYEARLGRYLAGFAAVALRRIAVPAFCVMLVAMALTRTSRRLAAAAIVIEMVAFAYGYNPAIPRERIAPAPSMIREVLRRDPDRRFLMAAAVDVYPPNLGTVDGVRDLRSYDVLQPRERIASLTRLGYDPEGRGFGEVPPPELAAMGVRWYLTRGGLVELPHAVAKPWPSNPPPDGFAAGVIVSLIALMAAIAAVAFDIESFFATRQDDDGHTAN